MGTASKSCTPVQPEFFSAPASFLHCANLHVLSAVSSVSLPALVAQHLQLWSLPKKCLGAYKRSDDRQATLNSATCALLAFLFLLLQMGSPFYVITDKWHTSLSAAKRFACSLRNVSALALSSRCWRASSRWRRRKSCSCCFLQKHACVCERYIRIIQKYQLQFPKLHQLQKKHANVVLGAPPRDDTIQHNTKVRI